MASRSVMIGSWDLGGPSTRDTITNSDSAHCLDATSYNAYTTTPNSRRLRRELMKHFGGRALWIASLLCFGGVTAADENPATLQVGTLLLHRCGGGPAYCGDLDRPMDPTGAVPGRLSVHFEYYPHSASGNSAGTLVATEGGPGFAATESREDYLALYRPLRRDHDVLIMDNRGTGLSGAVDCPELQSAEKWTVPLIGACGDSLGNRAPLYSTAYATDDLAAVLTALKIGRIDLYGDS